MEKTGKRALKRFGQHFLTDPTVIHAAMTAAGLRKTDRVLEVGPGKGFMTEVLVETGAEVTAVEIDRNLSASLKVMYALKENFKLINSDILLEDWTELLSNPPVKILTNLPYNISSPFFKLLCHHRKLFNVAVILLQKEFAERLSSNNKQNKKNYSALSVHANLYFEVDYICNVPPDSFTPRPKVESTLIRVIPKANSLIPEDTVGFDKFVKHMFLHRRKKLSGALDAYNFEETGETEEIVNSYRNLRAEDLPPEAYPDLFRRIKNPR